MTSAEFTQHVRFALQHLFEISVLDKGPGQSLASWLNQVYEPSNEISAGQRLHHVLVRTIEQMRPSEPLDANLPRHRSYMILKRRYVDGVAVQQLEGEFNTSSRQFRRDSHRAIEELVLMLWNLSPQPAVFDNQPLTRANTTIRTSSLADFNRIVSTINLLDLVVDAAQTLSVIISSTQTHVIADIPSDLPPVSADRVALRLALIKLLRVSIAHSPQHTLRLHALSRTDTIDLTVDGVEDVTSDDPAFSEASQLFALAEGALSVHTTGDSAPYSQCITARLSMHHRPAVLVVDDDPAMPRIIQRFLALKPLSVVSCNSTTDVVKLARETQPVLILLDVLMPKRDGWEILQELKANPDTYHIHLAVCSIWDERELALSLGADLFFQKPIGREALLECIEQHLQ